MKDRIPSQPGSYVLQLRLLRARSMRIGRWPRVDFPPGWYVYAGSAHGPGGLRARVLRHLKPPSQKRLHWHIDFLLTSASIETAAWSVGTADLECRWTSLMAAHGQRYPRAFGASDCRCCGHLLHFTSALHVEAALRRLGELTKRIVVENPPTYTTGQRS